MVAAPSPDDDALLAASQRGDLEAFGELVERHHAVVSAIAYSRTGDRALSEDIAQDTFLAAWRSLATLRDSSRLRAWLCGIARNLAGKTNRRRRRETLVETGSLDRVSDADPGPLASIVKIETEAEVWAALEQLPESYREPLVLFYREEQSVKQVAEDLGLSEETAKQRLSRGRKSLEQSLVDKLGPTLAAGRPSRAARAAVVASVMALAASARDAAAGTATGGATGVSAGAKVAVGLGVAAAVIGVLIWIATSRRGSAHDDQEQPSITAGAARAVSTAAPDEILARLRAAHATWRSTAHTDEPCVLRGSVRRADGASVGGAIVGVIEHSWQAGTIEPSVVETDASGAWTRQVDRAGAYTVSVSAPGQRAQTRSVSCERSRPADSVTVVLSADGASLRGTITDIGGGPIAGTTVWVLDALAPASGALFIVQSDPSGIYELRLAPGPYTVMVIHPDYTVDARPVTLGASAAREDFTLVPGASIEGTVTDATGRAVPGAIVSTLAPALTADIPLRWQMSAIFGAMLPAVADAAGRFRVRSLAPGNHLLTARAGTAAVAEPVSVDLTLAATRTDIALSVQTARTLAGFVIARDDEQRGLDGVEVLAFREDAPIALPRHATTDGAGRFELLGLAPGTYRVAANDRAHAPFVSEPIVIGERDRDDALVILERGVPVHGRIEPRGPAAITVEPAPGSVTLATAIQAAMLRAKVADDGTFILPAVIPGDYVITAHTHSHQRAASMHVTSGMTEVVKLALAPRPAITGQVVDDAGRPLARAIVVAYPAARISQTAPAQLTARTDEQGQFAIVGVAAGRHQVRVFDALGQRPWAGAARGPFAARTVEVPVAGAVTERLAVASGGRRLEGVVVGPDQQPVADAWVEVRVPGARPLPAFHQPAPVITDAAGRFAIDGLFGTELTVEAAGSDGRLRRVVAHARPGTPVRIELRPLGTLIGKVTYNGSEVTELTATIRQESTGWSRRLLLKSGLRIADLIAGEYQLSITTAAGSARSTVVIAGSTTTDITLSPWASVRGTVHDPDGRPWAGATVHAEELLDPALIRTDASGTFAIDRIAAGNTSLTIVADGDRVFSLDISLTPGQSLDLGVVTPRTSMDRQTIASTSKDLGLAFFVAATPPSEATLAAVAKDPMLASRGRTEPEARLWIVRVEPGSPAARAGLRRGDAVRTVGLFMKIDDGESAATAMSSLSEAWRSRGRAVPWTVIRDGHELRVDVLVPE